MTLQEYLTPDPSLREPRSCPELMPHAPPSLTSREMSLHSAISVHGYPSIPTPHMIGFAKDLTHPMGYTHGQLVGRISAGKPALLHHAALATFSGEACSMARI